MKIKKLQNLQLDHLKPVSLHKAVIDLLDDYAKADDKEVFEQIAKENIEKVYTLVQRVSPEAIVKKETSKKKKPTEKLPANKQEKTSKTIDKELDTLNKDIELCRAKIRKFNQEKRKEAPKKPKITRHVKIKKHFLAIANLIPPIHKDNIEVQQQAKKVLLRAHRGIMDAYKMNTLRAKQTETAIKEKYDTLKEKTSKHE